MLCKKNYNVGNPFSSLMLPVAWYKNIPKYSVQVIAFHHRSPILHL